MHMQRMSKHTLAPYELNTLSYNRGAPCRKFNEWSETKEWSGTKFYLVCK